MWSESFEMSFWYVIYNSLGMSAFWKVVRKLLKSVKFVGSFPGGRWEWTWGPLRVDFGTILGAFGCRKWKECNPEILTKSHWKKVTRVITGHPVREGGGALKQSSFHPGTSWQGPLKHIMNTPSRAFGARWRIVNNYSHRKTVLLLQLHIIPLTAVRLQTIGCLERLVYIYTHMHAYISATVPRRHEMECS